MKETGFFIDCRRRLLTKGTAFSHAVKILERGAALEPA
jgi:hypothetical protein